MTQPTSNRSFIVAMVLTVLGLAGAQVAMFMAYRYAPTQIQNGSLFVATPTEGISSFNLYESYRIFFTHLPCAYTTAVCCGFMLVGGVMWLLMRKPFWDHLTVAAAEVGLVAGALTLLTGSIWAKYAWGTYWNWEPRLTTMLVLWLAFAALIALRAALPPGAKRNILTAVYGILASPLYPLVHAAVEIGQGSHPKSFSYLLTAPEITVTKNVATWGIIPLFVGLIVVRLMWRKVHHSLEVERAA